MPKKRNAEEIYEYFKSEGYIVKSEYVNMREKMNVVCPNGSEWSVKPNDFMSVCQSRCHCDKCRKNRKRPQKRSEKDLLERGFVALEDFVTTQTPILLECVDCGYVRKVAPTKIFHRQGKCCPSCNNRRPYSEEEFIEMLNEKGLRLISSFSGVWNKCNVECQHNHSFDMIPANFIYHNEQCWKCHVESIKGEGSHLWNYDLTDEERVARRKNRELYEWAKAIKIRDSYTCQCCNKVGGYLVSHHIESWNSATHLRYDIDNGVTLCENCHLDFHKKYGFGNNNRSQYNKWLEER